MAADAGPKPVLSAKVMGLRFMQRAAEKKNMEVAQAQATERAQQLEEECCDHALQEQEDEHLPDQASIPAGGADSNQAKKGCTIIYDRQPIPQGMSAGGRLAFGRTVPAAPPAAAFQEPQPTPATQGKQEQIPRGGGGGKQAAQQPSQASGAGQRVPSVSTAKSRAGAAPQISDSEMALTLGKADKGKMKARPADAQFTSLREQKRQKQ